MLSDKLYGYNVAQLSRDYAAEPLEIYIISRAGDITGGLIARVVWNWLEISVLWVDEQLRGKGLGSELIRQTEQQARECGCVATRLSTWDFQALGFYEHLGYSQFGKLEGYPEGHTVYYLRKDLV